MTQVFLTHASTSPWTTPATMTFGVICANSLPEARANYFYVGNGTSAVRLRQDFVAIASGAVDTLTIRQANAGAPTDNIYATLYDSTGTTTLGVTNTIAGTAMTVSDGYGQVINMTFPTPVNLVAGTTYRLVLDRSGAIDASNYYRWLGTATNPNITTGLYSWDSTVPGWVSQAGSGLGFTLSGQAHTVQMISNGGNGSVGTAGVSGNGGGGGGGGIWSELFYTGNQHEIIPGVSTIQFLINAGGGTQGVMWENTSVSNVYYSSPGTSPSTSVTGGTPGQPNNYSGYPPFYYYNSEGNPTGGGGGNSAATSGGGGGGGGAGPNAGLNGGSTGTGGTGGCGGGGGNNGGGAAGGGTTSATFGAGSQGSSGTPGASSGAAGTGSSGGAGSSAITTGNSTGGAGGGTDTLFDASHGVGGGGGGAGANTANVTTTITGGNGGQYGAGGGGCGYGRGTTTFAAGIGGDALICITYTAGTPPAFTQVMLTAQSTSPWTFPTGSTVAGHTVQLLSGGGPTVAGSSGSNGNGSSGAGGGGYWKGTYATGTVTPGTTTFPFLVTTTGGVGATQWESSTNGSGNRYGLSPGGTGVAGGAGGAGGGTLTTVTPTITYTTNINTTGGAGGSSGKNFGGGGGGGAAGPNGNGGNGGNATSTGGAGGGGANNGSAGNAANATTSTFTSGGQGSTGSPGNVSASGTGVLGAGTGSSGGAGSSVGTGNVSLYGGNGGSYPSFGQFQPFNDTTFDVMYGCGGGGGGCGAITSATSGAQSNASTPGYYGGGGGGCGYISLSGAGFSSGAAGPGLIVIGFVVAAAVVVGPAPMLIGKSPRILSSMAGPDNRFNATMLASPLPAVTVSVTFQGGTLPFMGVG